MKKEEEPKKDGGRTIRNLGLVGGIIFLLAEMSGLAIAGFGVAAAGEIFSRVTHNSKSKPQTA